MFIFSRKKTFRYRKIERNFREAEPQEVLLDALTAKEPLFSQKKLEVPIRQRRVVFSYFLFFLVFLFFGFKLFQFQVIQGKDLFALAEKNHQKIYFERGGRGVIYDSLGEQIVFNVQTFDFVCDSEKLPKEPKERKETISLAANLADEDLTVIEKRLSENKKNKVLIAENLDNEKVVILNAVMADFPGCSLEKNIGRKTVAGEIFSPVIGYLQRGGDELDYIGKAGLEQFYEDDIRGQKGKIVVERNALGNELSLTKTSEPGPGNGLVLWLDAGMQKKAYQALKDSLQRVGAKAGAVLAIDPKTGGILSLVSFPSYDNNLFFEKLSQKEWDKILNDPRHPFWNRGISAVYPTGSTIKPLIAAAALEEKVIPSEQDVLCQGQIEVPNPWFKDQPWIFHDWTTHGLTDVRKAIAESCNVFFYTIGGGYGHIKGLGEERIKNYLQLFGWNELTGIDLPGEKKGFIPDKEWKKSYFTDPSEKIWLPGDTYNLSIGQGYLSITPIQVISSFSAIANGGKLLKPLMVKEIIDANKNVVKKFDSKIVRENFINPDNLKIVREGMREAVIYGSSSILSGLPVKAAAKTGTAQTSKTGYYHNWVTVFAPYDDPRIVLTVVVENVPAEQVAALPVAKEVLSWYFGSLSK